MLSGLRLIKGIEIFNVNFFTVISNNAVDQKGIYFVIFNSE